MRIVCSKENLIDGINIVQKAVSTKTSLPILEGILLECKDKFKLTGNDLEIGIECFVEADIQQQGSVVLNSKMFGDIVRRLPDSEVLIDSKEDNLVIIECENSHFEIKGLPSKGYPAIPEIQKETSLKSDQKTIRDMIKQTIFAVGIDENRPIMTGSLITCNDNTLTFVSIDGYRLALRNNNLDSSSCSGFNVVVPGKTLNEIVKILQPVEDELVIYSSQNQIMFDMGNCKVVSRLLEGEYLNYKSMIFQDYETKVAVNTKDMLSSMERASLITFEDKNTPVRLSISDDRIIITSNTSIGTAREEVPADVTGNKMDISFSPKYFIDALRAIEDESMAIHFTSNIGPCMLKPVEGDTFTYLLMPVRTRKD